MIDQLKQTYKAGILLGLFTLIFVAQVCAQGFSYVYIQGDKKTPIYTKVEGVMMPRLGKNYSLLSRLAPGPLNIEILFQQNEYPAVQFNILVPENGKRAFILQQKDGVSCLYDVEQNFYLKANNDISEDHMPGIIDNSHLANKISNTSTPIENIEQTVITEIPNTVEKSPTQIPEQKSNENPAFIEGIVFDNNQSSNTSNSQLSDSNKTPIIDTQSTETGIINSDCRTAITNLPFLKIIGSLNSKKEENERLGIILEACKNHCFSTKQSQQMLEKLESDVAKLTAIQKLYPRTTDQSNFVQLENILSDQEWKDHFRSIIQQ